MNFEQELPENLKSLFRGVCMMVRFENKIYKQRKKSQIL
jgi:hypothetical protein